MKRPLAWLALTLLPALAAAQNPIARGSILWPVDCPSVNDMVLEYDAAPLDRTYLRVQHMGDPGTRDGSSRHRPRALPCNTRSRSWKHAVTSCA